MMVQTYQMRSVNITALATATATITGGTVAGITQLDVAGTSAAGANLKLYEDTDNGTNFVLIKSR